MTWHTGWTVQRGRGLHRESGFLPLSGVSVLQNNIGIQSCDVEGQGLIGWPVAVSVRTSNALDATAVNCINQELWANSGVCWSRLVSAAVAHLA
mmetsp:Transcript_46202/g.72304  ORF Transcript_46202/g.72304 Transcript_46202/m.72304 type:complete len:94 (-) Transcript_46202:1785-2066(-)